ncbi:MAG: hypothetical protein IJ875_04080 [Solobacterium sp.]|nr:hypothetical protein [Solobacterium sp.]
MKKFTTILLSAMLFLVGCGGGNASTPAQEEKKEETSAETTNEESKEETKEETSNATNSVSGGPYKIAVANVHEGESFEIFRKYLDEQVAPALNMEFMYSEKLTDANGLMSFMDQAYAAGCDGIINMVTQNDAISQGAHKAEDWGMWFITENSAYVEDVATLPHNLGHMGASAESVGEAYKKAFEGLLSDGKKHSAYIFTGAAVGGNIGQGAASHFYSAKGMLEAFQEAYDLKFEKSIEDIVNTQDPGEVATGDPDVHIYLYPGRNPGDAVTAALPVLQSGTYDIFAAVFSFSAFTNAIADVEKSTNTNIKVLGTAQVEAQTKTGFESKDPTGDTVLNGAIINDLCLAAGLKAAILYNALQGASEQMKDNGKSVFWGVHSYPVLNAETYAKMEKINTAPELYIMTGEQLKEMTVDANPNITWEDFTNKLEELADLDNLLKSKGL